MVAKKRAYRSIGYIFIKKLAKYFVFLVLFSLTFIPIVLVSYNLAKENITKQSYVKLTEGMSRLENQIERNQEMSHMLLEEKAFINLLLLSDSPSPEHYADIGAVQRKLSAWAQGQDYFISSYILFNENPIFISGEFSSDNYETVYPTYFSCKNMSLQQWRSNMFDEKYMFDFDEAIGNYNSYQTPTIFEGVTMKFNTSPLKTISNNSVLACVLNPTAIVDSMILKDISEDGFVYIQNAADEIIISNQYFKDVPIEGNLNEEKISLQLI